MPWTDPCFLMYFLLSGLWLDMGILGSYSVLILKEITPEYSLEGQMMKLKLKLQYFGHLM